jgi:arylsulfatase A-like enzyme
VRPVPALLALAFIACPGPKPSPKPSAAFNRLNVLLVTIDTLRADHMGTYGYRRNTSPRMDALGREGTVFEEAYTYWPKTRGSFVALLTGRRASESGYSKTHPVLLETNPTLASVLKAAGYTTTAVVDNPNLAASFGYGKGFDSYRETWEEAALPSEIDRTRAITEAGIQYLREARPEKPFLLWLHYVNPHAPYTPPPPFDTAFLDGTVAKSPRLSVVPDYHGGIPKKWAVSGQDRLGYYVAQYDGEVATADREVGRVWDALSASAVRGQTLLVLASDHGESLGEHDYFFDHGENLFDPSLRIPLFVILPGAPSGQRCEVLASTLDLVPTILDAVKVSYPPGLAGQSLLPAVKGGTPPARPHLYAQNDRNLSGAWDRRFKVVATPEKDHNRYALFDRVQDPGETKDVARSRPDELRVQRRKLELLQEGWDREWAHTRGLLEGRPASVAPSRDICEKLKALGYVTEGCGT